MIKTLIFRCGGVVLNEEIIQFKIFEILWYYLRRDPQWKSFEDLLTVRDVLPSKTESDISYDVIVNRYLDGKDKERFYQEVKIFSKKMSKSYIKLIPGITSLLKNLKYYYKLVSISDKTDWYQHGYNKFGLIHLFHHLTTYQNSHSFTTEIQHILEQFNSQPEETVIISDRKYPDLTVAQNLGIHTIRINFDLKTKGIMPQGIQERLYFKSQTSSSEQPPRFLKRNSGSEILAFKPDEIEKILTQLESSNTTENVENQTTSKEESSIWNIAKEILNLPEEDDT